MITYYCLLVCMKYYNTIECCEKWFALRLDVCVHACMHYWLHERLTENCKLRTMQNEYEGQHTLQMYLGLFSDCFIRRNDINVANFCRNHSFFGFYTCRMCVLSVILLRHTWNFDNVTILLSRYIFKLREWIYGEKKRRKKKIARHSISTHIILITMNSYWYSPFRIQSCEH